MSSQAADISKSVFRVIRKTDEEWVGTGFVCYGQGAQTQPLYVTCAHVVASAFGSDEIAYSERAPEGEFYIDFPNSNVTSYFIGRVIPNDERAWRRKERNANERVLQQDIALLTLDILTLPDDVLPVEVRSLPRTPVDEVVFAFGGSVPGTDYQTNYSRLAEGVVQSEVGSLLQFKAAMDGQHAFIESGFSGGPLWSKASEQIVGIVAIADEDRKIGFAIPIHALEDLISPTAAARQDGPVKEVDNEKIEIPFVFQRDTPELLLKRTRVEAEVDEVIDSYFLAYLHGEQSAGKSSEVHRLHLSPKASIEKERTIWRHCLEGTTFDEMASELSEECLKPEDQKTLTPFSLINELHRRNLYLVLDGYSVAHHPSITPLLQRAAPLNPPTQLVVVSSDEPFSKDLEACSVKIPRVGKEEVYESIEALGKELTSDLANKVAEGDFDASAAYRIVREIRDGQTDTVHIESSSTRTADLFENHWNSVECQLVVCLSLIESSIEPELFEKLASSVGVADAARFKSTLYADSLIRDTTNQAFSVRDYCKTEVLERTTADEIASAHSRLGCAFRDMALQKSFNGFDTPTSDVIVAVRAIKHLQNSGAHVVERVALLGLVSASAARKGMHRHLSEIIEFEVQAESKIDLWHLIQLIQSYLALGRVQDAFKAAKLAQREIFSEKVIDVRLVVSLCNQFASVLNQANENALAAHLLGTSKKLFPQGSTDRSLTMIRESLKAWCDGRLGKYEAAMATGTKLLAIAQRSKGKKRNMQIGVEATRLGILEGKAGNFDQADRLLKLGVENFSVCDRRGELWALSHLCFFRIKSSPLALPKAELERLLDLQSTSQLVSEETFSHYKVFSQALIGDELYDRVRSQASAFESLYEDKMLSRYDIEYVEAFAEFLALEFRSTKRRSKADSAKPSVLRYLNRDRIEEASEGSISYIDPLLDDEPKETLQKLYDEIRADLLIKSPFYSRMVTGLLSRIGDESLIEAFVTTFLSRIRTAPRFVRLNYVGFFERCGRVDVAVSLLDSLRGMDSFRFHNLAANCYKKSNFRRSKFHNEQALMKASSPEEQARIHNNTAALYLLHSRFDEMDFISGQIVKALELRASHFWWPYRTKLALDLTQADVGDFDSVLSSYLQSQRLSARAISYIAELIGDPQKRMVFLEMAPRYLSSQT